MENCIASENAAANGVATYSGAVGQHTDAYGNKANFTSDASSQPDPDAGDFALDPGFSPAIDQGNPLSGYNDVDGSRNDMGAFGGPAGSW